MTFSPEEVRIIGLCAPQILKLLHGKEEQVLNKIYGELKNNKLDQAAALAEFACLRGLSNDIKNVLAQHHNQETKKHESANTKR